MLPVNKKKNVRRKLSSIYISVSPIISHRIKIHSLVYLLCTILLVEKYMFFCIKARLQSKLVILNFIGYIKISVSLYSKSSISKFGKQNKFTISRLFSRSLFQNLTYSRVSNKHKLLNKHSHVKFPLN